MGIGTEGTARGRFKMRCWVDKLTTPVGDITPGRLLQTVRRLLTMEHDPYRHASTFSLFPSFFVFFSCIVGVFYT